MTRSRPVSAKRKRPIARPLALEVALEIGKDAEYRALGGGHRHVLLAAGEAGLGACRKLGEAGELGRDPSVAAVEMEPDDTAGAEHLVEGHGLGDRGERPAVEAETPDETWNVDEAGDDEGSPRP